MQLNVFKDSPLSQVLAGPNIALSVVLLDLVVGCCGLLCIVSLDVLYGCVYKISRTASHHNIGCYLFDRTYMATSTPVKSTSEARHVPENVTLGDMQAVAPHITTSSSHDGPVCTDKILARVQCAMCTYSTTDKSNLRRHQRCHSWQRNLFEM